MGRESQRQVVHTALRLMASGESKQAANLLREIMNEPRGEKQLLNDLLDLAGRKNELLRSEALDLIGSLGCCKPSFRSVGVEQHLLGILEEEYPKSLVEKIISTYQEKTSAESKAEGHFLLSLLAVFAGLKSESSRSVVAEYAKEFSGTKIGSYIQDLLHMP